MAFAQEITKIILQIAGALFVGWLAVRWGLSRYKREKLWEKRTEAISAILASISELDRVNDKWFVAEIHDRKYTDDYQKDLGIDWRTARKKLDALSGLASLIVPEAVEVLKELHENLSRTDLESWIDELAYREKSIDAARSKLIEIGKKYLS